MFVYLVVDPATTAGAGVPLSNTLSVTSSRSGAGTWHLYAVDDQTNEFGIRSYNVALTGTVPAVNHRSPNDGAWDTATSDGPFAAGFNDLRSGSNVTPIVAGQGLSNLPAITGFGQSASDFVVKETAGGGGNIPASHSGVISGAWGIYADPGTSGLTSAAQGGTGQARNALFLAEGTYTGAAPTVSSASMVVWTNAGATTSNFAQSYVLNTNPFIPEPATLTLVGLAVVGFGGLVGRRRS